jgi:hypothetical protein
MDADEEVSFSIDEDISTYINEILTLFKLYINFKLV